MHNGGMLIKIINKFFGGLKRGSEELDEKYGTLASRCNRDVFNNKFMMKIMDKHGGIKPNDFFPKKYH